MCIQTHAHNDKSVIKTYKWVRQRTLHIDNFSRWSNEWMMKQFLAISHFCVVWLVSICLFSTLNYYLRLNKIIFFFASGKKFSECSGHFKQQSNHFKWSIFTLFIVYVYAVISCIWIAVCAHFIICIVWSTISQPVTLCVCISASVFWYSKHHISIWYMRLYVCFYLDWIFQMCMRVNVCVVLLYWLTRVYN